MSYHIVKSKVIMARVSRISTIFNISFYFTVILVCLSSVVSANKDLDEDNWREILDGEWMVEFYAPWCPACSALAPAWSSLSSQLARAPGKQRPRAAAVDVTKAPGLSGRFMVTALPTIFHVKEGVFRRYKGPRDMESMLAFVQQKKWEQTEPIPAWKSPNSIQMSLVAQFFKLSQVLRNVHNTLMETYGLPTWGSYLIFALCTIATGALLGLMVVCVIDLLYPPRKMSDRAFVPAEKHGKQSDDEEELINDDIVDDNEHDSDAEKNSPSDSSGDEKPASDGDVKPEVRKRRPRKDN